MLEHCSLLTTGVCISANEINNYIEYVFEFMVEGQTHRFRKTVSTKKRVRPGDRVRLKVNPSNFEEGYCKELGEFFFW